MVAQAVARGAIIERAHRTHRRDCGTRHELKEAATAPPENEGSSRQAVAAVAVCSWECGCRAAVLLSRCRSWHLRRAVGQRREHRSRPRSALHDDRTQPCVHPSRLRQPRRHAPRKSKAEHLRRSQLEDRLKPLQATTSLTSPQTGRSRKNTSANGYVRSAESATLSANTSPRPPPTSTATRSEGADSRAPRRTTRLDRTQRKAAASSSRRKRPRRDSTPHRATKKRPPPWAVS